MYAYKNMFISIDHLFDILYLKEIFNLDAVKSTSWLQAVWFQK